MKTCARCFSMKPFGGFSKGPRYRDGYQSYCKACMRIYRQEVKQDPQKTQQAKEYYRKHYEANRDKIALKRRKRDQERWQSNAEYRERKKNGDRSRYQSNPATRKRKIASAIVMTHIRRARIRQTGGRYTQAEWRELCAYYDHRCLACGEQKPLTPDHVIPISRGGLNIIDNIQPLCLDCNLRKHAKTIDYRPGWSSKTPLHPDE